MLNTEVYKKKASYGMPISREVSSDTRISTTGLSYITLNLSPQRIVTESSSYLRPIKEIDSLKIVTESSSYLRPINEIDSLIDSLKEMYIFVEPKKIKTFLFSNKDLIPFLQEATAQIHRIFGLSVLIYLELHTDPEERWDELFIVIKSSYNAKRALLLEKKLFEEWFIYIMDKVQGRLNITEEPL